MRLPPFTLVYQSGSARRESATGEIDWAATADADIQADPTLKQQFDIIQRTAPELVDRIKSFDLEFMRTLIVGTFAQGAGGTVDDAIEILKPVIEDLQRYQAVIKIALWDIDARVGGLPRIIEAVNYSQKLFTFFELQAPLPAGIVSRPERVITWARKRLNQKHRRLTKKKREEMAHNVISNDFFTHAKIIHSGLGVKYLVGITQGMIAGEESDGSPFWNFFTNSDGARLLISTYDLRRYAREAGRPFEVGVMMLVIAQILVEVCVETNLKFHPDTGCVFDENIIRDNIVNSIRELKIEERCLELMAERYRTAALKMMDVLRSYSIEEPEMPPSEDEAFDTDYWLEQLTKLGEE